MINTRFLNRIVDNANQKVLFDSPEVQNIMSNNLDDVAYYISDHRFMRNSYTGRCKILNDFLIANKYRLMDMFKCESYFELKQTILNKIMINVIVRRYGRYKQAYVMDETFAKYLINSTNIKIPLELFNQLPYTSFYIDLQSYKLFPNLEGCIIDICISKETGLPNITAVQFVKDNNEYTYITTELLDRHLIKYNMVSVDQNETNSVEYIDFEKSNVVGNAILNLDNIDDDVYKLYDKNMVQAFWMVVMQTIFYLGSYEPDIQIKNKIDSKHSQYNTSNIQYKQKHIQINNVGFRYGNAIRVKLKETSINQTTSSNKGHNSNHTKCSHVRRAHWHTYRVGKGRTETIVKWLPPIFIVGNGQFPITIHPVKGC